MTRRLFAIASAILLTATALAAQTLDAPPAEPDADPAAWPWLTLGTRIVSVSTRSRSVTGSPYFSDLARVRLDVAARLSEGLSARVMADLEGLAGSVLDTVEFDRLRTREPEGVRLVESGSLFLRERLYRGQLEYRMNSLTIAAGRLRVPLGVARLFSSIDILNPYDPFAVEKEERPGVDGASLEWQLSPLSSVSAAYVPKSRWSRSSLAARYAANVRGVDVGVMGVKSGQQQTYGISAERTAGGAGVRTEGTYTTVPGRPDFIRATAGSDYAFRSGVRVTGEYYFNADRQAPVAIDPTISHLNLARHSVGGIVGYDVTPLLTATMYMVYAGGGAGRFVNPEVAYGIRSNLNLVAGAMVFSGGPGARLSRVPDTYYIRAEWFFQGGRIRSGRRAPSGEAGTPMEPRMGPG